MITKVYESPAALARASAARMLQVIADKPNALCCLAAGFTQNETYGQFVNLVKERQTDVSRIRLMGLDEWGGLNGTDPGSCRAYLDARIIRPLGLKEEQILFFPDGKQAAQAQCLQADALLDAQGPIDLMVLGIGMNGHLGFNEPGTEPWTRTHQVVLSDTSRQVGQKYFDQEMPLQTGLTLGLKDLLAARTILLQAVGQHKAGIVAALLRSSPDTSLPASFLHDTDCLFMMDEAARG